MSDRTPLPQQEIPGWWIKWISEAIQQFPRPPEMDKVTGMRWMADKNELKRFFAKLLTPPKIKLSDKRFHILETFDLYIPEDIKELAHLLPKRKMAEFAPTKLLVGQKLKVDFIMIQAMDVNVKDCRVFLRNEGALLLGDIGALLVIREQERLGKKNMRIPLCCEQWIASIGEGDSFTDVYGIYSPDYVEHQLVAKGHGDIQKQKGIFFLFCFRDAFE